MLKVIILYLLIHSTFAVTCTDPNASKYRVGSTEFTSSTFTTDVWLFGGFIGAVSGDIFQAGKGNDGSNSYMYVNRLTVTSTQVWYKTFISFETIYGGFHVDSTETHVYVAGFDVGSIRVIRLSGADGSVVNALMPNILSTSFGNDRIKFSDTDNCAHFAIEQLNSGNPGICQWIFSSNTFTCFEATDLASASAVSILTLNLVFFSGADNTGDNLMFKADFTLGSPIIWANKWTCPGSCFSEIDDAYYDTPSNIIYSFVADSNALVLSPIDATTGSVSGTQYRYENFGWYKASAIVKYSNDFYMLAEWGVKVIIVLNQTTSTFSYYSCNKGNLDPRDLKIANDYLYVFGSIGDPSTSGYRVSTPVDAISDAADISSTGIVSFVSFTTGNYLLSTMVNPTYTLVTDSWSSNIPADGLNPSFSDTIMQSDVAYYNSDLTYTNLVSGTLYTENIFLTCSTSGIVPISYSLSSTGTGVPSWVSVDGTSQTLTFTPDTVATTTTYSFGLAAFRSDFSTVTTRNVYLTVTGTNSGGAGDSGSGSEASDVTSAASDAVNVIAEPNTVTTVASTSMSVVVASSAAQNLVVQSGGQGLWSMVNQFQFYILLPLVGAYVPDAIIDFLQGMDFVMFNFKFFDAGDIPLLSYVADLLSWDENDSYLVSIGIESTCELVNQLQLISIVIICALIHILILFCFKINRNPKTLVGKIWKFLFMFFTFKFYIRTFVEAYIVLSLGTINELYGFDLTSVDKQISFILSIFLMAFLIFICLLTYFIAERFIGVDVDKRESYFTEIVEGTKPKKSGRLAMFIHILRILSSVLWIVLSSKLLTIGRIIGYWVIQLAFLVTKIITRPYESTQDNIIEIMNDSIHFFACVVLTYANTQETWDKNITNWFMIVLMMNSILIMVVQLVFLFKNVIIPAIKVGLIVKHWALSLENYFMCGC